jgi:8-oxo-dGTP pyrophosphatase MutT (NUDIX family)
VRAVVRAAGGVVARSGENGGVEVLLVHRPRYDDWTLPKGKALPGESDEDCALREVLEETGLTCELGRELAGTSYADADGHVKAVRYWQMTPVAGGFAPSSEIDEVRWLPLAAAPAALSYERDVAVLDSLGHGVL